MSFGVAASSPARCASVSSSVLSDPPPLELDLPDPERDDISTMEFLAQLEQAVGVLGVEVVQAVVRGEGVVDPVADRMAQLGLVHPHRHQPVM